MKIRIATVSLLIFLFFFGSMSAATSTSPTTTTSTTTATGNLILGFPAEWVIGTVSGIGFIVLTSIGVIVYYLCFKKPKPQEKVRDRSSKTSTRSRSSQSSHRGHADIVGSAEVFDDDPGGGTLYEKNEVALSLPGFLQLKVDRDFTFTKKLTEGGMGVIMLCEIRSKKLMQYAKESTCVAKISSKPLEEGSAEMKAFIQEISIMYYLKAQRNVVRLLGYSLDPAIMVVKYYPGGSLLNYIEKGVEGFENDSETILDLCYGIAHGLCAMHFKQLAHRDIKPANVLLEILWSPKKGKQFLRPLLTDFGISCPTDPDKLSVKSFQVIALNGASLRYAAPEVLSAFRSKRSSPLDPKVMIQGDLYSYAIVMYELFTRILAWKYDP